MRPISQVCCVSSGRVLTFLSSRVTSLLYVSAQAGLVSEALPSAALVVSFPMTPIFSSCHSPFSKTDDLRILENKRGPSHCQLLEATGALGPHVWLGPLSVSA